MGGRINIIIIMMTTMMMIELKRGINNWGTGTQLDRRLGGGWRGWEQTGKGFEDDWLTLTRMEWRWCRRTGQRRFIVIGIIITTVNTFLVSGAWSSLLSVVARRRSLPCTGEDEWPLDNERMSTRCPPKIDNNHWGSLIGFNLHSICGFN